MGVAYIEKHSIEEKKVKACDIFSKCNVNYTNSGAYNECNFLPPSVSLLKCTKERNSIIDPFEEPKKHNPRNGNIFKSQHSWSKVYHSPVERQVKETVNHDNKFAKLNYNEICTQPHSYFDITRRNAATSTNSFKRSRQNLIRKAKYFYNKSVPRSLCPCCTGGDDNDVGPYRSKEPVESFDSIELKSLDSLDLDASVMSFYHMYKISTRNVSTIYRKFQSCVARSACEIVSNLKRL